MGKIVNAPTTPNSGGYENKVKPPPAADTTAGANSAAVGAQAFEQRAGVDVASALVSLHDRVRRLEAASDG